MTRELGVLSRVGQFQWQLGRVALAQGEPARAVPLLEALRRRRWSGTRPGAGGRPDRPGAGGHARGEPEQATALLGQALRLRQDLGESLGIVECLEALAAVAAGATPPGRRASWGLPRRRGGRWARRPHHPAADLAAAARAARAALGRPPTPRPGRRARPAARSTPPPRHCGRPRGAPP